MPSAIRCVLTPCGLMAQWLSFAWADPLSLTAPNIVCYLANIERQRSDDM
jgi:hypothetical protein